MRLPDIRVPLRADVEPPGAARRAAGLPWPAPVSLLLHAAALGALLPLVAVDYATSAPSRPPSIEIELVDQDARSIGARAEPSETAEAAPAEARPDPAPSPAPPPVTPASVPLPHRPPAPPREALLMPSLSVGERGVPMPLPFVPPDAAPADPDAPASPDPVSQAPAAPAAQPARARVTETGAGELQRQALLVRGDNVVPPKPDARHRNKPPAYPAEAARQNAQGTVWLLVHVLPSGKPGYVRITRSSGNPSLDRAAAEAVRGWQFTPAERDGERVAFDYMTSIRFAIGNS